MKGKSILPKFFALQEKSGVPDNTISFFGVNREKKTLASIAEAFNIKKVKSEAIGKLKELAEELAELSKNSKRLSNEEETFKLDEARKFRDAIKNIQALQYKVLRLDDVVESDEEKSNKKNLRRQ